MTKQIEVGGCVGKKIPTSTGTTPDTRILWCPNNLCTPPKTIPNKVVDSSIKGKTNQQSRKEMTSAYQYKRIYVYPRVCVLYMQQGQYKVDIAVLPSRRQWSVTADMQRADHLCAP